jgi:hypothetical protein
MVSIATNNGTRTSARKPARSAAAAAAALVKSIRATNIVPIGRGIKAAIVTVTPEMAREWLQRNPRNRHFIPTLLERYTKAMTGKRWVLNGEPIIFNKDNELVDGQHRLRACVDSGESFDTVVVLGIAKTAFKTMNTGRSRTSADVLSIEGYQYASTLGAVASFRWQIGEGGAPTSERPEHAALVKLVQDCPDLVTASEAVYKFSWRPMKNATFGVLFQICGEKSKPDRDIFFERLEYGNDLEKGSPVLLLRRRLDDEFRSRSRLARTVMLALGIKAWNAFRDGKPMTTLSWKGDVEPFPMAK